MEEIILNILNSIRDDIDYSNATGLIDDKILSSFDIINVLSRLSEEFNIEISPDDMTPENFNSITAITEMIQRLS